MAVTSNHSVDGDGEHCDPSRGKLVHESVQVVPILNVVKVRRPKVEPHQGSTVLLVQTLAGQAKTTENYHTSTTQFPHHQEFHASSVHRPLPYASCIPARTQTNTTMTQRQQANELAEPRYWNDYYSQAKGHEWLKTFSALEPFLQRRLVSAFARDSRILHLGSGDSTIPSDLRTTYRFRNQLCVDFSDVVVQTMASREDEGSGIEWRRADVRDMREVVADGSVDVAFDKSTLDAMVHGSPWDPPEDVWKNTRLYMDEVFRVLSPDGVFLCIMYHQPHFIKPLISSRNQWHLEVEVLQDDASSFEYHAFILRKAA